MSALQTSLAIALGQWVTLTIKTLRQGSATSLPGKLALKVQPHLLKQLSRPVSAYSVAVTGTNGKSTTAGLINQCLQQQGLRVVHNLLGANMHAGIVTALLQKANWLGQLPADAGVFEVDEASMPFCSTAIHQRFTVVTNLFRDQLDRYGELDTTARYIMDGLINSEGKLILNADDPSVAQMATRYKAHGHSLDEVLFYGIENVVYPGLPELKAPVAFPKEVTDCPLCHSELQYDRFILGHLGHYRCLNPSCGFTRPKPDVAIEQLTVGAQHSEMTVRFTGADRQSLTLPLPGVYNAYNAVAAVTAAYQMGCSMPAIQSGLSTYHGLFGRAEKRQIHGKNVMMLLIKNPTGAAEVLKVVAADPKAQVLIMINDNYADGRDVSWLWDTPFEYLQTQQQPIWVSGQRADDMALRLLYGGIPTEKIQIDPQPLHALEKATQRLAADETLYVLPTYTALLDISQALGFR